VPHYAHLAGAGAASRLGPAALIAFNACFRTCTTPAEQSEYVEVEAGRVFSRETAGVAHGHRENLPKLLSSGAQSVKIAGRLVISILHSDLHNRFGGKCPS